MSEENIYDLLTPIWRDKHKLYFVQKVPFKNMMSKKYKWDKSCYVPLHLDLNEHKYALTFRTKHSFKNGQVFMPTLGEIVRQIKTNLLSQINLKWLEEIYVVIEQSTVFSQDKKYHMANTTLYFEYYEKI